MTDGRTRGVPDSTQGGMEKGRRSGGTRPPEAPNSKKRPGQKILLQMYWQTKSRGGLRDSRSSPKGGWLGPCVVISWGFVGGAKTGGGGPRTGGVVWGFCKSMHSIYMHGVHVDAWGACGCTHRGG